jgi:hypothetical protein
LLLGGLVHVALFSQDAPQTKPQAVAVLDPRGNPKITEMDRRTFRATIREYFITANKRYELLDGTRIEQVLKDQKVQRDSPLIPATMKRLGERMGADIVCAMDLLRETSGFSAEINLMDVESGRIYYTVQEVAERDSAKEIKKLAEALGDRLLKSESPRERDRRERDLAEQGRIREQKLEDERRERLEREREAQEAPKESKLTTFFKGVKNSLAAPLPPTQTPEPAAPPSPTEAIDTLGAATGTYVKAPEKPPEERPRREAPPPTQTQAMEVSYANAKAPEKAPEERLRQETPPPSQTQVMEVTYAKAPDKLPEERARQDAAPSDAFASNMSVKDARAAAAKLAPSFTFERTFGDTGESVTIVHKALEQYRAQGLQAVTGGKEKYWHSLFVEIRNGALQATSRYVFGNRAQGLSHTSLTIEIDNITMNAQMSLDTQRLGATGVTTETAAVTKAGLLRFIADNPAKKVNIRIEGDSGANKDYALSEVAQKAIAQTLELYDAMETLKKAGISLEQQYGQ